jgi:hypothetical protein
VKLNASTTLHRNADSITVKYEDLD